MRTQFGLGRSRRDTYLLKYTDVDDHEFVEVVHKIRDGIAAWVKIRVTDYGKSHRLLHVRQEKAVIVEGLWFISINHSHMNYIL